MVADRGAGIVGGHRTGERPELARDLTCFALEPRGDSVRYLSQPGLGMILAMGRLLPVFDFPSAVTELGSGA